MWIISLNYTPCIPHHTKTVSCYFILLFAHSPSPQVRTALALSPNLTFGGNPVYWEKNPFLQQKNDNFPHQKNPPHQTAIFNKSFIYSYSHCCFIIFLTPGSMYKYVMLLLICRWLLNLICSMKKALNGQNSFKQNPQPPSPAFNATWKTLLQ